MGEAVPALPWGEAIIATLAVLGLLGATLWLLRRGLARHSAKGVAMRVEGSLTLGERRSLVIVQVEGRRLLVGVSQGSVGLVTELKAGTPDTDGGGR